MFTLHNSYLRTSNRRTSARNVGMKGCALWNTRDIAAAAGRARGWGDVKAAQQEAALVPCSGNAHPRHRHHLSSSARRLG